MIKTPLLSVCMITYGHEKYIQQAIESILMQQTSFDFELIIANDCSPDATTKVVNDLLQNHPKAAFIRYIEHTKNKGMHANFLFALHACTAKYIALCEGDDYWTDPLKLQKQVDFLEANPDYEVCFTNIKIINDKGEITKEQLMHSDRQTIFEQKHLPTWAPTLTRVFKNRDFTNAIPDVPGLDTIMLLYQSKFGKLRLINEITGVYRKHDGGIYSSLTVAEQKQSIITTLIESLKIIDDTLLPKYIGMLFKKLLEIYFLDTDLFKINKYKLQQAFQANKKNMSLLLKSKIQFAFFILSLPFINRVTKIQPVLLKIFNQLFIY